MRPEVTLLNNSPNDPSISLKTDRRVHVPSVYRRNCQNPRRSRLLLNNVLVAFYFGGLVNVDVLALYATTLITTQQG